MTCRWSSCSDTALCWYNTVTSLQNYSTKQQPRWTTAQSNSHAGQQHKATATLGNSTKQQPRWTTAQSNSHAGQQHKATVMLDNSTKQQSCWTTARSHERTCVCDRHMHSGMQLDARTLWRPCSARKSSSEHCSGMASAPASVTREGAVIDGDLLVWGHWETLGWLVSVGKPRVDEPEMCSAARPSICQSCI